MLDEYNVAADFCINTSSRPLDKTHKFKNPFIAWTRHASSTRSCRGRQSSPPLFTLPGLHSPPCPWEWCIYTWFACFEKDDNPWEVVGNGPAIYCTYYHALEGQGECWTFWDALRSFLHSFIHIKLLSFSYITIQPLLLL